MSNRPQLQPELSCFGRELSLKNPIHLSNLGTELRRNLLISWSWNSLFNGRILSVDIPTLALNRKGYGGVGNSKKLLISGLIIYENNSTRVL